MTSQIIWLGKRRTRGVIRQRTKVDLVVSGRVCSVQKLSGGKDEFDLEIVLLWLVESALVATGDEG